MQDPASELRRIRLLRTSVNKVLLVRLLPLPAGVGAQPQVLLVRLLPLPAGVGAQPQGDVRRLHGLLTAVRKSSLKITRVEIATASWGCSSRPVGPRSPHTPVSARY
jgi:hypothetical protein